MDTHRALWRPLHPFVVGKVVLGDIFGMRICFSVVTIVSRGFTSSMSHWIAVVVLDGALVRITGWRLGDLYGGTACQNTERRLSTRIFARVSSDQMGALGGTTALPAARIKKDVQNSL